MIINKKRMKKILFWLLIVFTAGLRGQEIPGIPAERIYLQTDKQMYLAGELVYLKVFTVTPEKKPLSFSKIVYVELLDDKDSRVQVKIGLTRGIGEGWLELPLDLPTGHYRMVAYTRFMLNEGETVFFEKNIGVVNTFRSNQIWKEQSAASLQALESNNHATFLLQLDKTQYTNREKGILKLSGLPGEIHTLSVSIAGKSLVDVDGTNDIRQWEKQVPTASANPSEKYLPEYEGHIITGKIAPLQTQSTNRANEAPVPILSFPGEHIYFFEGLRDETDNVSFFTTNSTGVKEVFTTAYTPTENLFRIDLQSPFVEQHVTKQLPVLRMDSTQFDGLAERTVALQALYFYTKDWLSPDRPADFRFNMNPSQTYILDEWTRFAAMGELTIEFIAELRFRRNERQKWELSVVTNDAVWGRPLVFLDGTPIFDHDIIYRYDPLLVERINIYSGERIFGGMKFDGIAEFLTYHRNYPGLSLNQSTRIVNYAGTQAPRRLYTPDYSTEENRQSRLPDYRHTLLWEPALQTKGKNMLEVPFYTSDFAGEFRVTVEGLTKKGEIIAATTTFIVR